MTISGENSAAFTSRYTSSFEFFTPKVRICSVIFLYSYLLILIVSTSIGNSGLCWTVPTRNRDTAVPAVGNSDLQTLICVLVARPRRCLTLSNPVPWQNWMVAYLGCTLQMKMLFRGWPVMAHETHTKRRILVVPSELVKTSCRLVFQFVQLFLTH